MSLGNKNLEQIKLIVVKNGYIITNGIYVIVYCIYMCYNETLSCHMTERAQVLYLQ